MSVIPIFLFSQQKKPIRPLPTQSQIPSQTKKEFIPNPEYEKALIEYKELINKYPDKKELYFNLGNLNYLSGDSESALQNYKNSLINSDPNTKADALYNMGNTYYQMGDLQNSVDFFKEALSLNPNDEDIRYNYELSKRMLEQQPQQKNQDKNQDSKESDDQKDQESQQSQAGDENEQGKNSKNSEKGDNENEQKQSEDGEENVEEGQEQTQPKDENEKNEEAQKQKTESQIQAEKEKQLGKEEAEAILNALKADANNLKPRKYKAKGLIKLEKDW